MKPPFTHNHGAQVDTEGHSVFHLLPPDVDAPTDTPPATDWFDTLMQCVEFAAVTLAIFCLGGLVAGLLFQLFVRYAA